MFTREDDQGRPQYNWAILDHIFDTYMERGLRPYVQIGFMPEALSTHPKPYQHEWVPGGRKPLSTGWAYPPKDYKKWAELVFQWVNHCVERYSKTEVEHWYWEVWNEPNIFYWRGTPEEYHKLYDFAVDAVKRALPTARVGGPHVAGPRSPGGAKFLREFLDHCVRGTNHATGKQGSPLDFVAFHAKGVPEFIDGHVRTGIAAQLQEIDRGFGIVASYPELRGKPIIIGESDPDGCAACPATIYPQNGYRNGTLFSSYTAAVFARKYLLADKHGVNFEGAVTWAFEFEDQPYFAGFRVLSTNGIALPVLNVFRMFGMMGGQRVAVESSADVGLEADLQARCALQARRVGSGQHAGRQVVRAGLAFPRRRRARAVGRGRAVIEPSCRRGRASCCCSTFASTRITATPTRPGNGWDHRLRPTPEQYGELERSSHLVAAGLSGMGATGERRADASFRLAAAGGLADCAGWRRHDEVTGFASSRIDQDFHDHGENERARPCRIRRFGQPCRSLCSKPKCGSRPCQSAEARGGPHEAECDHHGLRAACGRQVAGVANARERADPDIGTVGDQAEAGEEATQVIKSEPKELGREKTCERNQRAKRGSTPRNQERMFLMRGVGPGNYQRMQDDL